MERPEAATVSLEEAGRMIGIGRSLTYQLAQEGRFPARVLRVGRLYRVPRADLRRLLGETADADATQPVSA